MKHTGYAIGASLLALAVSHAAQAQTSGASTSAERTAQADDGLGTILVYAQRKARGEQLQDVPMAISAVDAATLEAAHAVDIRDVGRLVPNAQLDGVGTYPGFANFFIRGVGVSTSVRSLDPAVNIIQDGMVIGYQAGAVLDTFDTESIEVLRGPQGVLFGRNATGGVVHLRSKRPTGDTGGSVRVTLGNAGTVESRSTFETALVDDVVMARFAVLTRNNDGFFHNRNSGQFVTVSPADNANPTGAAAAAHPEKRAGKANEIVIKSTWVFKPADTTTFTLFGQYLNYDDDGGITRSYFAPGMAPRQQQSLWGYTPSDRKWDVNMGTVGYTKIKGFHLIGELEQDIGPGVLTAVGAYRKISYDATLNVGGDPYDALLFPDGEEEARQTSFEARYNVSVTDTVDLLFGGFYFNLKSDVYEGRLIKLPTSATDKRYQMNLWDQSTKSFAFFTNADWRPTPELTVSAGVRYSKDTKRMHVMPLTVCPGQSFESCGLNFLNAKKSWDNVSPRFVVNYKVDPDIMLYASYSRGYRAGNFNARAPSAGGAVTPADPEKLSSWEAGVKSDLLDHRLRINLGYFHQKYKDIQRLVQIAVPGESPLQQLYNAAEATIQGVELEASVLPVRGFRIDGALGYTHARYDAFNNLTGLPAGVAATSLKLDRVPKWTASISGSYERDIGVDTSFFMRMGYTWRSHVYTDVLNLRDLEQKAYGLLDANIGVNHGRWTLSAFGRNLGNTEYAEIKSANIGYNAFGGSPRYYGVELGVEF